MPSIAITRSYEAIYILDPDLGDEQVQAIVARYRQVVENTGGTVASADVWERRKLAYAIKGRTEGVYVVMHFTGEAKVEAELRRVFQISEDQLRAMIVKPEPADAPALPESTPETAAPAPAAAPAPPEAVAPTAEPEAAAPATTIEPETAVTAPETAAPEPDTAA